MPERVVINYSVLAETKLKIDQLAEKTYRSQGYVIDWLVGEVLRKYETDHPEKPALANVTNLDEAARE